MLRSGDFSMLKVWAGLEARSFLQASIESVSYSCVSLYTNFNPYSLLFMFFIFSLLN